MGSAMQPNNAPIVWLPHLDPVAVLIMAAPQMFTDASPLGTRAPGFARRAAAGEHWLIHDGRRRLPVVFMERADATTPAAAVIPFDADFVARTDAALRLWRLATSRPLARPPDCLSPRQRRRLKLILRALDGRLAGHSYRVIAQALFGETRRSTGPAWKTHDLRDRTIRLCRRGLELMRGGYLDLLRHRHRR